MLIYFRNFGGLLVRSVRNLNHSCFPNCVIGNGDLVSVIRKEVLLIENFISKQEEHNLIEELDVYLTKHKYQEKHWDYAIKNYRETERKNWRVENRPVIDRLVQFAIESSPDASISELPTNKRVLPLIHILDMASEGEIMPHVDSVRMENGSGRSTNLRSLVRPVSPLSRLSQPTLLLHEDNNATSDRNTRAIRSRSRSPMMASTVHMPSKNKDPDSSYPSTPGTESRRIVIRRSDAPLEPYSFHEDTRSFIRSKNQELNDDSSNRVSRRSAQGRPSRKFPRPNDALVKVDRANTCPILIRLSYSTTGRHSPLTEFNNGHFPKNELHINTWLDCSLQELAIEVLYVHPFARRPGTRLHFIAVFPDKRGTYRRRELGVVIYGFGPRKKLLNGEQASGFVPHRGFHLTDDSAMTLASRHFHVGDFIDVAIISHVPGSLGGYSMGKRPIGPTPLQSGAATNLI